MRAANKNNVGKKEGQQHDHTDIKENLAAIDELIATLAERQGAKRARTPRDTTGTKEQYGTRRNPNALNNQGSNDTPANPTTARVYNATTNTPCTQLSHRSSGTPQQPKQILSHTQQHKVSTHVDTRALA